MRILIASPYLPWPVDSGGGAAQFSTLKCLAADHEFTLVCPVHSKAGVANAKELQAQLPGVKVRGVYCGEPAMTASPGDVAFRLARKAGRMGKRLLAPPAPVSGEGFYYPFNLPPEKFIAALGEEVSRGVDLCQAEFAEMLPLGSWFPRELPKVLIYHQISWVYVKRLLDTRGRGDYSRYLEAVMRIQEEAFLQTFDGVITFSEEDRAILLGSLSPEKVFNSPFPLPADVGIARELPEKFDGRFVFVASGEHPPNRDALGWLLKGIWPEIKRQLPQSRLVVIGKWGEAERAAHSAPGVEFPGFVDDLAATLRGGTMLVPLRIGSGIRVKIMAAMAQGVPVVTTSVGSEGMPVRDGEDILVRDSEAEFAAAAVGLSKNPAQWRQLSEAGREVISNNYSPEAVRRRRNQIYTALALAARTGGDHEAARRQKTEMRQD